MKIAHISPTPLAGHPIKIVRSINKYTDHSARFIDLNRGVKGYGNRVYRNDLIYGKDDIEIAETLEDSDIIHVHQTFDLNEKIFHKSLLDYQKEGKKLVRQFASEPSHFKNSPIKLEKIIETEKIPHLVMAQYHERYYRHAYPIPLIVDEYRYEKRDSNTPLTISYSPSNKFSPKESRWGSKGYYSIMQILKDLEKTHQVRINLIYDKPHSEVITEKRNSDIVIDEVVTGTFHTSALEGVALGRATFSYMDQRTMGTLSMLTNSNSVPFISPASLRSFKEILTHLVENRDLVSKIGKASKNWFDNYYSPRKLITHYTDIYENYNNYRKAYNSEFCQGQAFLNVTQFDIASAESKYE